MQSPRDKFSGLFGRLQGFNTGPVSPLLPVTVPKPPKKDQGKGLWSLFQQANVRTPENLRFCKSSLYDPVLLPALKTNISPTPNMNASPTLETNAPPTLQKNAWPALKTNTFFSSLVDSFRAW